MVVIKKHNLPPVTAADIKLALLEYFRFQRQWICVDECLHADVIADTGKWIIEVEVKVSKQDLIKGEERKGFKHHNYQVRQYGHYIPNMFFFCIPLKLKDVALNYILEKFPKYGLIVYCPDTKTVIYEKGAHRLHDEYSNKHRHQIAKRCSAKLITLIQLMRGNDMISLGKGLKRGDHVRSSEFFTYKTGKRFTGRVVFVKDSPGLYYVKLNSEFTGTIQNEKGKSLIDDKYNMGMNGNSSMFYIVDYNWSDRNPAEYLSFWGDIWINKRGGSK